MIIYHYCSEDTFRKIIDSKCLWISDFLNKSNDSKELKITFEDIWQEIREKLINSNIPQDDLSDIIYRLDN